MFIRNTKIFLIHIFVSLTIVCGFIFPSEADDLGKFEEQYKKKNDTSENNGSPNQPPIQDENAPQVCQSVLDCIFGNIFREIFSDIIGSPIKLAVEGEKNLLSAYPYESDLNNYIKFNPEPGDHYAFTFAPTFQKINPNTDGYGLNLDFRSSHRYGVIYDYIHYAESNTQNTPTLDFYSLYFFITPSESNNVIFDMGLGGIVLSGNDQYLGPSLTLNWTLFPIKPILIKTHASFGGLNWKPIWDLGGEAGIMIGQIEVYLGYRSFVGPVSDLSGPLGGLRFWF